MNISAPLQIFMATLLLFSFTADADARKKKKWRKKHEKVVQLLQTGWWTEKSPRAVTHLIINKKTQQVSVYADGKLISKSRVSTGKPGLDTPGGLFTILSKNRYHRSNIYSNAPMPFMQRITWSGIALHESRSVPNRPASHGCIRLPGQFAKKLFSYSQKGAQVIITNREVAPQEFTAPGFFQIPGPVVLASANPEALEAISAKPPIRVLITRFSGREKVIQTQTMLNKLLYQAGPTDGYMGRKTAKAITHFQKDHGYNTTGSLTSEIFGQLHKALGYGAPRNGRIYVRRKYKTIIDESIAIKDAEIPLGTHQFSVAKKSDTTGKVKYFWLALTVEETGWSGKQYSTVITEPSSASGAFARLTIPQNLKDQISALLTPGSTIAISDQGISKETGKGTDFIVLTKTVP